jgi:hypothetical protein
MSLPPHTHHLGPRTLTCGHDDDDDDEDDDDDDEALKKERLGHGGSWGQGSLSDFSLALHPPLAQAWSRGE